MKSYKMLVGIAAVCICLMSFGFVSEDSSADLNFGTTPVSYGGFTDMDDGYVDVFITNSDADKSYDIKVVITDNSGNEEGSATATIAANTTNQKVTVKFGYGSEGTEFIKVHLYDVTGDKNELIASNGPFEITVEHSIWKDWVTYLVVVIIVIVIIILAYFYIRGAPDRAARKAEALQGSTKVSPAGRMKYDAGSERKAKRK